MADYSILPAISAKLAALGYRHNGDQGIPQREAFNRLDDRTPWTGENCAWVAHNLYLCPQDSRQFWRRVTFRDCLNQHEAARLEYERIKRDIEARCCGDRKVYAGIKENEGHVECVCGAGVESRRRVTIWGAAIHSDRSAIRACCINYGLTAMTLRKARAA